MARHTSEFESFLVSDELEGVMYPNEPLARYTTYRIGGPARFYVQVDSLHSLMQLIELCRESDVPWFVIGRGSNLLVSDDGFDGVVIKLGEAFRQLRFDEESQRFIAGGGVALSTLVQEAFHRSLGGFEFAVGTPGTIGGAVRMNAGTSRDWIGNRVVSAVVYTPGKTLTRLYGSDIEWGYRTSSFAPEDIIVECELSVEPAEAAFIRAKMEASRTRRAKTQPLTLPSCGSVFKNPEGASAAQLIEELGLKGTSIGGAMVSEVHANFIVNTGNASACDVRALIEMIQARVNEAYGIALQPEVRFIGF